MSKPWHLQAVQHPDGLWYPTLSGGNGSTMMTMSAPVGHKRVDSAHRACTRLMEAKVVLLDPKDRKGAK